MFELSRTRPGKGEQIGVGRWGGQGHRAAHYDVNSASEASAYYLRRLRSPRPVPPVKKENPNPTPRLLRAALPEDRKS